MTKKSLLLAHKGFTLIELLVVIGILAVLLAITLVAINPAKQFSQANDTQRQSDVNAILNAVTQNMADNNGTPPDAITNVMTTIADDDGDPATLEVDICLDLVTEYLAALPVDPTDGDNGTVGGEGQPVTDCAQAGWNTEYRIMQSATDGRITVEADSEVNAGEVISVTR